jgi:D-alanyl-lipoteichoic acid acyltransferase DltB (MBOAT superfamily)
MTFNSIQFLVFFVVVLALYHRLDVRGQNRLVVAAGSVFYGAFDWRFLGLLYLSTAVDFSVGRALQRTDEGARRKGLVAVSVCTQIGLLAVFKYLDFFATNVTRVLGWFGLATSPVTLRVLLPVGISFYTFQTLAYVFSVYRREIEAEHDLITFAAFVAWFPQMVAGPIERATSLLPQIRRRRDRPSPAATESALLLIVRGLFKKVVIADGVATFVNAVYTTPGRFGAWTLAVATVGFAIQVYGDFSGYSDIARGVSRLLGVELRWNFEQPFLSRNMREFWQRWHTSLGWWFSEFVGRPLGGASRGQFRAIVNVLVIFTLIGLWHGAAWTFVFWGFLNGVFVASRRLRSGGRRHHPMKIRASEAPQIAATFGLFCAGAVFFRATSFGDALTVLHRIVTLANGDAAPSGLGVVPVMVVLTFGLDIIERRRRIAAIEATRTPARLGGVATAGEVPYEAPTFSLGVVPSGVFVGILLLGVIVFSGGAPTPFLYFQF